MIFINSSPKDGLKFLEPFSSYIVPVGIGCLLEIFERDGISAGFVDEQVEENILEKIKSQIEEKHLKKPYIFGFSTLTYTHRNGLILSRKLRELYPDSIIIFGGIHPSAAPDEVIAEDHIDIVFRGEGEEVLPDLYRCLKEGRDFSHLPNITFKKNGRVISNEQSSKVDKLDTLPLFPYHHFDPKVYNLGFVLSSRGCPYKCTFCSNRATTGFVYRYRSAEIVLQEVELLYRKFNQKKIVIVDDIFSVNKKMIREFLAGLRKKDFYGKVRFSINARGDNLGEDILQSLYDANFRFIYLGFETASENLMKEINKGETVADNVRAARIAKKIGFHVTTSFIFALPGETHQDRMEAVRLADELDLDLVKYNNTIPYPGTPLYETAKEENRLHVDGVYENFNSLSTFLESPFKKIRFAYVPKGSTEEEIRNDILYAHFAFYFSYRKIKNLFLNQSTGLSFSPGKTLKSIFKKIPAYGYVGYTLLLKLITLGFNVLLGKNTSIPRKKFWSLFVNSLTGKKKTTKMLEGTPMLARQQQ